MKFEILFSKDIQYFLHCAHVLSLSKAAKQVHVSQSTLSIALKRLEDELGCQLFERGKGLGMLKPTPEALQLLDYIQKQKVAVNQLGNLSFAADLPIKVGTIQSFSRKYLMPALRDLRLLGRSKVFHVRSKKMISALKSGQIDLAFAASLSRPSRDKSFCIELRQEKVGIVGLKSKYAMIETAKSVDDLKHETWIVGDQVYDNWPACLDNIKAGYYIEDHYSARFLILDGYGIAPMQLDYFTDKELQKLAVSKFTTVSHKMKLYALVSKGSAKAVQEECFGIIRNIQKKLSP